MSTTDDAPLLRPVHGDGITLVAYDSSGNIITSGENAMVHVFKSTSDEDARVIDDNTGPVMAIDCKGKKLVTACEDHHVRLFDLSREEGCLDAVVTRFQGPVKAVALNNTGSACASAGVDMVIKIVTFVDMSVRELHGCEGTVRSLCFDPQLELLASAGEDGYLRLWNISSAKIVNELFVLPNVRGGADPEEFGMYGIDFDPKGNMLAAPVKNTIQIFDRSLEYMYMLKDLGHDASVSVCKWSRDGRYLASVSIDGLILIWEVSSRQCVASFRHPRRLSISCLAWHPNLDELAYADLLGNFSVWRQPVRESVKEKLTEEEIKQIEDDKKEEQARDGIEHLFDDEPRRKIKLHSRSKNMIEDSDEEDTIADFYEFVQPPFQPSSTPAEESKRFLVWNDTGYIISREEEATSAIDIEFHNAAKHRPIRLVDHFGFTMGAMNEFIVALAAPSHHATQDDSRDHPRLPVVQPYLRYMPGFCSQNSHNICCGAHAACRSVLFVRNVNHWSTDETWQIFLPEGEEIECIAVGTGDVSFVAAATNKGYMRLYSNNGVALDMFSINGPIVTMAAYENHLMIIHHHSLGVNGNQSMQVMLLAIHTKQLICRTDVSLSPGAQLSWAGFSESGLPVIADSDDILRALTTNWGSSWIPLADLKRLRDEKSKSDYYWVTGLSDTELICIVCRGGETYPKVHPRPVVSTVPLNMPIVTLPETTTMEERFMRSKIFADHLIQAEGLNELDQADYKLIQQNQRQLDQHILACISRSVQSQRWGRALDLTTRLLVLSSYDVAIKLAMKAKSPMLAERMSLAKQAQQMNEKRRLNRLSVKEQMVQSAANRKDSESLTEKQTVISAHVNKDESFNSPSSNRSKDLSLNHDPSASETTKPGASKATTYTKPIFKLPAAPQKATSTDPTETTPPKSKLTNPFSKKRTHLEEAQVPETKTTKTTKTPGNPIDALNDIARSSPQKKPKAEPGSNLLAGKMIGSNPFSTKKKGSKGGFSKKEKKPTSGFLLWLSENRKEILKNFPDLTPKEVAKQAGQMWRSLSAEVKNKYLRGKAPTPISSDEKASTNENDRHRPANTCSDTEESSQSHEEKQTETEMTLDHEHEIVTSPTITTPLDDSAF